MKEWWLNLTLIQKQRVAGGLVVIGLFVFYEMIWSPFVEYNDSLRHQISKNQALLNWMQQADERITSINGLLHKSSTTRSSIALMSLLQKEIEHAGFSSYVESLNQSENNSVKIVFHKINFDKLITWLTALWKSDGIVVQQINVTPNGALGIVDVTVDVR